MIMKKIEVKICKKNHNPNFSKDELQKAIDEKKWVDKIRLNDNASELPCGKIHNVYLLDEKLFVDCEILDEYENDLYKLTLGFVYTPYCAVCKKEYDVCSHLLFNDKKVIAKDISFLSFYWSRCYA